MPGRRRSCRRPRSGVPGNPSMIGWLVRGKSSLNSAVRKALNHSRNVWGNDAQDLVLLRLEPDDDFPGSLSDSALAGRSQGDHAGHEGPWEAEEGFPGVRPPSVSG